MWLRGRSEPKIEIDEDGIRCGEGERVRWVEIEEVVAYKRDELTTDLICMELRLAGDRHPELHEDLEGWGTLVEELPAHLNGLEAYEKWFSGVAFPAFDLNLTTLWKRG